MRQSEEEYVANGFDRSLEAMGEEARKSVAINAITLGIQQLASSRAMYRSARSLVELTRPTIREQLVSLPMRRAFVVGAWTLEADENPPSGEAGEGLEGTGVEDMVVPDAGHPMMFQNPDGFASAIAAALDHS